MQKIELLMAVEHQQKNLTVSTVLCAAHVDMAIDCLGSIERLRPRKDGPIRFRIHDDGSLSESDCARLEAGLSSEVEVVRREIADEMMREHLRNYPALFDLRDGYPPALKMLDAPLYDGSGGDGGKDFVCVDGDILFLQSVSGALTVPDGVDALFMNDRESNYSLRSWQLLASRKLRLPARVNVGIIAMRRAAYDVEFLDWFVGKKIHHGIPWVVEQAAWAALGFRSENGCRVLDPDRVRVMRENENTSELAIGHFTGRTRHLLPEFVKRSRQAQVANENAVSLTSVPVAECRVVDLLGYEVRRVADRLRPRSREKANQEAAMTAAAESSP